jgi:hypothetical protein
MLHASACLLSSRSTTTGRGLLCRLVLTSVLCCLATAKVHEFSNQYYNGVTSSAAGASHAELLDQARRMLSVADTEFMTPSGVYDEFNFAMVEGAKWTGNIWTQNTYGFGYASAPVLPDPLLTWLGTSYLWWFDHVGDGGQGYGGLADVPAGMLCDNGSPTGCNYMQCGPGRSAKLTQRHQHNNAAATAAAAAAAASATVPPLDDTAALGHDFIIEGTLAGGVMMSELLLATRNATGAARLLPVLKRTSDFLEVKEHTAHQHPPAASTTQPHTNESPRRRFFCFHFLRPAASRTPRRSRPAPRGCSSRGAAPTCWRRRSPGRASRRAASATPAAAVRASPAAAGSAALPTPPG